MNYLNVFKFGFNFNEMIKIKRGLARLTLATALSVSALLAVPGCVGFQPYVKGREARPDQTYVEVAEGRDIHYVKRGSKQEDGRTILLFHGLGGSVYEWKNVIPRLAESYEIYALDLPGFGDSDPVKHQKTVNDLVESVNIFMEKQGIERAVFVGHSIGSSFIDAFSLKYPKKVEMLISTGGYIDKKHTKLCKGPESEIVKIPIIGDFFVFLAKISTGRSRIRKIVEKYTYDDSNVTSAGVEEIKRNLESEKDFDVFLRMGVNFHPERIGKNPNILHYYLVGEQDNLIEVTDEDYLGLIMLKNCGHWVASEKSDELADLIDKLIKKQIEERREEKLLRLMESG